MEPLQQAAPARQAIRARIREKMMESAGWLDWLIVIFVATFVAAILFDPVSAWLSCKISACDKNNALLLVGLGAVGLMLWQRARSAAKHAGAMAKVQRLAESGRIHERLKASIDHLGNDKDSVRVGAAHELYHLAKDTEDYAETVCDILCAHISQKTQEKNYQERHKDRPSAEIKTFLNLLCGKGKGEIFNQHQRDLSFSYLRGLSMRGAQLQGADLSRAQLQEVWLKEADLSRAQLQEANLRDAYLSRTQLQGADLSKAQLQNAWFWDVDLQEAELSEAQLPGARFFGAKLQEASLTLVQMQEAYLPRAEMQRARLFGAKLQGADLSKAQLQGARSQGAQMQAADLSEAQMQAADLSEAQLQGARLQGAQLQGADLTEAQLRGVRSSSFSEPDFQGKIRARAGKESDFSGIVFSGGLDADRVKEIIASMPASLGYTRTGELKSKLKEHVGKEASNKLPADSGAVTGAYNEDDAKQWIEEYERLKKAQKSSDAA